MARLGSRIRGEATAHATAVYGDTLGYLGVLVAWNTGNSVFAHRNWVRTPVVWRANRSHGADGRTVLLVASGLFFFFAALCFLTKSSLPSGNSGTE